MIAHQIGVRLLISYLSLIRTKNPQWDRKSVDDHGSKSNNKTLVVTLSILRGGFIYGGKF